MSFTAMVVPGAGRTNAATVSPHLSSGRPTTATDADGRVREQQLLELARVDVLAAADDHVLQAALDACSSRGRPSRPGRRCAASRRRRWPRRSARASRSSCASRGSRACTIRRPRRSARCRPVSGSTILISTCGIGAPIVPDLSSIVSSGRVMRRDRRALGLPEHDRERRAQLALEACAPVCSGTSEPPEQTPRERRQVGARERSGARASRSASSARRACALAPYSLGQREHEAGLERLHAAPACTRWPPRRAPPSRSRRCGTAASWSTYTSPSTEPMRSMKCVRVVDQAAVVQQRTLREAGGAGRVLDHHRVGRVDVGQFAWTGRRGEELVPLGEAHDLAQSGQSACTSLAIASIGLPRNESTQNSPAAFDCWST